MRLFRLLCVLSLFPLPALADEAAPFGLRWGDSVNELRLHGVLGEFQQNVGKLQLYRAAMHPAEASDTQSITLAVDPKLGLQRIQWVSAEITGDPSGKVGLERYRTLKRQLSERYGDPKSADEELIAGHPASLYQCLAEDGCGAFVTVWRTPDVDVRERLLGNRKGNGWLEVIYLGPDWSDIAPDKDTRK